MDKVFKPYHLKHKMITHLPDVVIFTMLITLKFCLILQLLKVGIFRHGFLSCMRFAFC